MLKVVWNINKLVQGNLIVHISVELTQTLVLRMDVNEVMFQPTLKLHTI
jgi:hypothetical protein